MKTAKEIQERLLNETGIKSSVKKGAGSMKDYLIFTPMLQNGNYPNFPIDFCRQLIGEYPETEPTTIFASGSQIHLHKSVVIDERTEFKKERKAKKIEDQSQRTWGSKNSQLRLDKASARYAKALRRGEDRARYY